MTPRTPLLLALACLAASCATGGAGSATHPVPPPGPASSGELLRAQRERAASLDARGIRGEKAGEFRAYLAEMEYFGGRGNPAEVTRLDGLLNGVMAAAAASPAREPVPAEDSLALVSRLREMENESARRRIAALEKERDAAVAEVVRNRARVQGMASSAEAAAMFAEARVLVDRMAEEAVSSEALDHLRTARRRLEEGKAEMEKGNPGGAAFLFDQVSNSYGLFRKGNPRQLVVTAAQAVIREKPSPGAKALKQALRNTLLEGLSRQEGWVQVRDAGGVKGWVAADSVR